jgi:uncharacterized protein YceH (UPF0502 family)
VSDLPFLDALDQRILGALLEKQTTVPATYPLTANALRSACNQSNNRDPVVDWDLQTVEQAARSLKDRGLLRIVWAPTGRRTLKYHQILDERLDLEPDERALLTVLMLRGEQAPGELRTRTERLHPFADRGEVESCLARMARRPQPLVRELPRRPGQQDARWTHLLGPVPEGGTSPAGGEHDSSTAEGAGGHASSRVPRFDHVGITVADLGAVTEFFVGLGLEVVGGPMTVEGEFLDTVIGIPGSSTEIVMLRAPDGGTTLELSSFTRPEHRAGSPTAMANELGLRNVAFEVGDLQEVLDRLVADGYALVGGVGRYEDAWLMAYVRGPEGIIVSLAERLG